MTRGIVVHNRDYSEDRRLMGRVEMVPILFFSLSESSSKATDS